MSRAVIDVVGMATVVSGVESGRAAVLAARTGLRSSLDRVDLDASRSVVLEQIAQWADGQLPSLRRRLALAQVLEGSDPSWSRGTVTFDDLTDISTRSPQEATALAVSLADSLRHGGRPDQAVIEQLVANANDPYVASAFARAMGPDRLTDLLTAASAARLDLEAVASSEDPAHANDWYRSLVGGLSSTISTATRAGGELAMPGDYASGWVKAMTAPLPVDAFTPGEGRWDEAAALGVILGGGGRFATPFLDTVGTGVVDYERAYLAQNGTGSVWRSRASIALGGTVRPFVDGQGAAFLDPVSGIMSALGRNPEAAQDVLGGGPTRTLRVAGQDLQVADRLAYLLTDRTWRYDPGSGAALGSALFAATTIDRDDDARGRASAALTSQTIALIGEKTGQGADHGFLGSGLGESAGWQMPEGMRVSVAGILASYGTDAYRAIVGTMLGGRADDLGAGWSRDGSGDWFTEVTAPGAVFNSDDLAKVVGTLGQDQDQLAIVLAGVTQAGTLAMDSGMRRAMAEQTLTNAGSLFLSGVPLEHLSSSITYTAQVTGWVLDRAYEGDKADEDLQARRLAAISAGLDLASSLPFVPKFSDQWLQWGYEQGKGQTLDAITNAVPATAGSTYDKLDGDVKTNLQVQALDRLLVNGYLSDEAIAGTSARGVVINSGPPNDAIVWSADGKTPLRFDTDSNAFKDWYPYSGLPSILAEKVVGPYRDALGLKR